MRFHRTQIFALVLTILIVGEFVLMPVEEVKAQTPQNFQSEVNDLQTVLNTGTVNATQQAALQKAINSLTKNQSSCSAFHFDLIGCVNVGLEWITNSVLLFVGDTFLTLMGVLLNGVMIMTLNMSSLVNSIGVVDSTWSIIRDIASILIIFFLLYTSIEIIIGVNSSKVQHIIVMVVVAGVLINFSLFFTKVLVDTSNLVSLAFYRAIAPSGANYDFSAQAGSASYLSNAFTSGGLSDEIMTGLGVTSIYQMASSTYNTSTAGVNPLLIIGSGIGGFMVMMIAGLSFLAAAILFSVRIGLLIILMAFSPFYFIGLIIPNIKSKISDKWRDLLLAQCMIMPVYMLFMYVALRVITAPAFKSFVHPTGGASTGVAGVSVGVIGLIVQYIIGMIFISIPLIAAMEYASFGKDFANMATNKVKSWGKSAVGSVGRNTAGAAATKYAESKGFRNFAANNPIVGGIASKALGGVSSASFGGAKGGFTGARKADEKSRKELYKNIGSVNRADYATEEEFKQAQRAALTSQRRYVEQLKNTPISKILGANRSGFALSKDQDKAENKEYEDENKKRRNLVNNQITSIETAYSLDPRVTRAIKQIRKGEEVTGITSASPEIMNVVNNIKNLQKEYDELDKKITSSKKAKEKDAKIQEAKEAQKELKDEEGESEKPKNEKSGDDKPKK